MTTLRFSCFSVENVSLGQQRRNFALLVRELGLPLLSKGGHTFLLILGSEKGLEESTFEARSFLQVEFEGCIIHTIPSHHNANTIMISYVSVNDPCPHP